jgi:hypothetical protein
MQFVFMIKVPNKIGIKGIYPNIIKAVYHTSSGKLKAFPLKIYIFYLI